MPLQTLTLVNENTLTIDIPAPLYRVGETYQVVLAAGSLCPVVQPAPCLVSPLVLNVTMPPDPMLGVSVSAVTVSPGAILNLTLWLTLLTILSTQVGLNVFKLQNIWGLTWVTLLSIFGVVISSKMLSKT